MATGNKFVNLSRVRDHLGIEFKPASELKYYEETWQIHKIFNITEIKESVSMLNSILENIEIKNNTLSEILYDFNVLDDIRELDKRVNIFDQEVSNRKRKSLLPVIGKLDSWLFGLMTEEDKTNIENTLEIIKGNEKTTQHFIDSQVTIDKQILEKYEELEKRVNKIINNTNALHQTLKVLVDEDDANVKLASFVHAVYAIKGSYSKILKTINLIVDSMYSNNFTPDHIDPVSLRKILKDIKSHANEKVFPFKNIHNYYKYLKVSSKLIGELFVITIEIPFFTKSSEMYHIFEVNPYPSKMGNYGLMFDSKYKYIIVDNAYSQFIYLKEENTKKCIITNDKFICPFSIKSQYINDKNSDCITEMYLNKNLSDFCDNYFFVFNIINPYFHKINNTSWYYLLDKSETAVLSCEGTVPHIVELHDTGIIQISKNCSIFIKNIKLKIDNKNYEKYINFSHKSNGTKILEAIKNTINSIEDRHLLDDLKVFSSDNKDLKNQIHNLSTLKLRIEQKNKNKNYFLYILLILLSIIVIVTIIICIIYYYSKYTNLTRDLLTVVGSTIKV